MRTIFCCLLLVFLVQQLLRAQELSWPIDNGMDQNSAASDSSNRSVEHLRFRNSPLPDSLDSSSPKIRRFDRMQSLDSGTAAEFCAFIRTYRVRRENKGSDVVTPAGYTTCVPSRRFEVRSAVMTDTAPSLPK